LLNPSKKKDAEKGLFDLLRLTYWILALDWILFVLSFWVLLYWMLSNGLAWRITHRAPQWVILETFWTRGNPEK
jgi:hypothetical protein